jgi:hypothetical protein
MATFKPRSHRVTENKQYPPHRAIAVHTTDRFVAAATAPFFAVTAALKKLRIEK